MKKIANFVENIDKRTTVIGVVLIVFTMAPVLFQGIICNDELQTRFLRKQGMMELIKDNISTAIAKGRTIGGFVDVRQFSFLTNNMYINRIIDVLLILVLVCLFSYFIWRINQNKAFSCLLGVVLVVCLPITFEHGAPNAFVAITVIPAILVVASFLFFWNYLDTQKKRYLFCSMVPYLIAMMQYEFVVTYVLIFYALIIKYLHKEGKIKWPVLFRKAAFPTLLTILYIFVYFFIQHFNQSNYAGNTIGFVSIKSSLAILVVLAKSSFPGYFTFNDKYEYLEQIYLSNLNNEGFLKIIIGVIVLLLIYVITCIFVSNEDKSKKWNWLEMVVAIIYIIVPALPNSISSLYQGTVSETFFTWLPVSIFLYFASTYFVVSIIWNLLKNHNKYIVVCAAILLSCYVGRIQSMNYVIANQQHYDYVRLLKIEGMFDMNIWNQFDDAEIQANDIYEARNLLAVHDGFWSQYIRYRGGDVNVKNEEEAIKLYFLEDEYFVMTNGKVCVVLSPKVLNGCQKIKISEEKYLCATFAQGVEDCGYYIYSYEIDGFQTNDIPVDEAVNVLRNS